MRVLILSCNTGEGHNSCAKAIKELFDNKGEYCVLEDGLRFISQNTSRFMSWGHTYVYRHLPWLFNWGYGFTENHKRVFKEQNMLYNLFGSGAEKLNKYITDDNFDTIICTHPFTSLMMTEVKRRYQLKLTTAFVATDYTCSPSVKDSKLDYYFIPNENLIEDFECPHIPKKKIICSGIPIRQMFYKNTGKNEAKQQFQISPGDRHIVMMCGSMGCGPIEELVGALTEEIQSGMTLTVVCGTNDKLKAQLESIYGNLNNLHILGFVKDMSALLDSADVYLTKAGGISVTEAATKQIPMVFINAVAGCETYNADFYSGLGCGIKTASVENAVTVCKALVTDGNQHNKMKRAFDNLDMPNAALCIYGALKGVKI